MQFNRPAVKEPARESELSGQTCYSRNHLWIALLGEERARVGVEAGLAAVLGPPKAVVLPAREEKIRHNDVCAWIVLEGGTLPLRAPLTGVITEVNARLADQPSALSTSPSRDGWLFEVHMRTDEPVLAHLMAGKDAERVFANDVLRFHERLRYAIDNAAGNVGATLHDGGEFIGEAAAMLGYKRYIELLRKEFNC
jgi:glycine cleavage system H protein